jgi:hypothetical protein
MDLPHLRTESEKRHRQVERQRREIRDLRRARISADSAEELLGRMLAKVGELCARSATGRFRKYLGTNKVITGTTECPEGTRVLVGRKFSKRVIYLSCDQRIIAIHTRFISRPAVLRVGLN